jgi:hypothetical protein
VLPGLMVGVGVLGIVGGCLLDEGLPCPSHWPSSSFWPITIALLGGVALGGTNSGVLSRMRLNEEPVAVGMSCSSDCRILDREVSSEGNDASRGSCLGDGPVDGCLKEDAAGGGIGWLITGLWVG